LKKQKLSRTTTYKDRIVKEVIEIQLHPSNFNREAGFIFSRTWKPVTNTLYKLTQHRRQPRPAHEQPDWLTLHSAPQPEPDINTGLQGTQPPIAT
jgi:hypothetical protein